jgi:hypothetical protein
MRYITKTIGDSPHTRRAKSEPLKNYKVTMKQVPTTNGTGIAK